MNNELQDLIIDIREQVRFLRELGVTELDAKLSEQLLAVSNTPAVSQTSSRSAMRPPEAITAVRSEIPNIEIVREKPVEHAEDRLRLSDLPTLSNRPGAGVYARKPLIKTPVSNVTAETSMFTDEAKQAANDAEPGETIEHIRAEIGHDCTRCKLSTLGRSRVVNSVGNFSADLMFVGEAPGADEDEQGEPFVGKAGQLLTKIIEGIGLKRDDVFIGNISRCRPPGNRAPEPDESVACKPFLFREIAVVRPRVIVVLGATAAQNLLETKTPIGKLRGQFHDYRGTKVMPTFHPAYLLRDPHKKREVWEDMKLVRDFLASPK
jgi:DNA polymerase